MDKEFKYTKHYIDRDFVDSKDRKVYDVVDPRTEKVLVRVADGDKYEVDMAVEAARKALLRDSEYRKMDTRKRGKLLYKLADLFERDFKQLVDMEVYNTGKVYHDAEYDVKRAIDILRYYAGYTDKYHGKTYALDEDLLTFERKEAIGVVGLIGTYDHPLLMFVRKMAPIVTAGTTMVYKPSYKTPLTTLYAAYLTHEAGFPRGVINVVLGKGEKVGKAIGMHYDIKMIRFTGRKEIGRKYFEYSAESNLKKVKLHLRDNNTLIVLKDSEIDDAVRIAHHAAFYNMGQSRYTVGRVYVQEDIYDRFVKRSIDLARKRLIGDSFDKDVKHTTMIDELSMRRFLDLVDLAKKDGAKVVFGGKRHGDKGYFVEPTILTDVTDDMKITHEKIFGPMKMIIKFKKVEDILDHHEKLKKNRLVGGVITKDIELFMHIVRRMDTGLMWLNTWHDIIPQITYGERKEYGTMMGHDEVYDYLKTKTVQGYMDTKKFDQYTL